MPKNIAKCVKCLLCFINFITLLCGLGLFGVGLWTQLDRNYMESLLGTRLYGITASILIIAGVAIALVSFFGCCGAKNEMKWMLVVYFTFLFFIFLAILVAAIMAFMFSKQIREKMPEQMKKSIRLYGTNRGVTKAWDTLQEQMKCCGIEVGGDKSFAIWSKGNELFQGGEKKVPDSCCKKRNDEESIKACNLDPENLVNNRDCYHLAEELLKEHSLILGGIGFGAALVVVIGMIMSCVLIFAL